jgi:hypothetical protein
MAMTPDKMYRPEIHGPKGKPAKPGLKPKPKPGATKPYPMPGPNKPGVIRIKPIGNKEVNPVYRNQGFM